MSTLSILPVTDDHDGYKWLDDINCADMDLNDFFVQPGHTISEQTLNTCRRCPVRRECVVHVYTREIKSGYYAGLSPSQRDGELSQLEDALKFIETDLPTDLPFDA